MLQSFTPSGVFSFPGRWNLLTSLFTQYRVLWLHVDVIYISRNLATKNFLMVHIEFVCPVCGHECPMLVYAYYSSIHAMLINYDEYRGSLSLWVDFTTKRWFKTRWLKCGKNFKLHFLFSGLKCSLHGMREQKGADFSTQPLGTR